MARITRTVRALSPPGIHSHHSSVGKHAIYITICNIHRCQAKVHPIKIMNEAAFGEVLNEISTEQMHLVYDNRGWGSGYLNERRFSLNRTKWDVQNLEYPTRR